MNIFGQARQEVQYDDVLLWPGLYWAKSTVYLPCWSIKIHFTICRKLAKICQAQAQSKILTLRLSLRLEFVIGYRSAQPPTPQAAFLALLEAKDPLKRGSPKA